MLTTFKSMPLLLKIVLVCVVVACLYQLTAMGNKQNTRSGYFTPVSDRAQGYRASGAQDEDDDSRPQAGGGNQNLAQFQSQQVQIQRQVQQCEAQMTEATNRQAMAAMNGQMYNQRPACEQYMPQWIAQEAYVETEIQRIHDPNDKRSVREITGITPYSGDASPGRPGRRDDGTAVVERYDRQAVRGDSMYTDENGEEHELPTQNHYYRDRSSGRIIGSDQPNPPNDGRDYEQFSNAEPQ